MQGNGFKVFAIAAFLALSLWELFPTLQNTLNNREIAAMNEDEAAVYRDANFADLQATKEQSLNLGLDLQGGMHVTLEVGAGELFTELADDRADEAFEEAIRVANAEAATSRDSYVDLFVDALGEVRENTRLARYFRDAEIPITARSSDDEVVAYLRQELSEAISRATEIIRQRVDRYGVTEPSIQQVGSSRIVVELPGVDDPQRVRDLLKGTAKLEFRLMADPAELQQSAFRILQFVDEGELPADTTAADSTGAADAVAATEIDPDSTAADSASALDVTALSGADAEAADPTERRFSEIFRPSQQPSVIFGEVAVTDTARVNEVLSRPEVARLLPPGIEVLYYARPQGQNDSGADVLALLGVRRRIELEGDVVTDASPDFDPLTNAPLVSLSMNNTGAQRWSQLTGANIGKPVSIVLDDVVYTFPNIRSRISGGRTSIEGVERSEAEDIVTVLKSGALPAPVQIIEERTVGPSLGAESVRDGTRALLVGFLLVIVFMGFYYRTGGVIAGVALLLNVFFIFGILAAFQATLTLPGMAGIVLTIGMAVDANVLIFERIREEQDAGKTLKASIDGGFAKALSAIADANITTFFIGVILYSFGIGPIQGFAVTLMAGIVTSLFTALVVTRLLLDYLVQGRGASISFG